MDSITKIFPIQIMHILPPFGCNSKIWVISRLLKFRICTIKHIVKFVRTTLPNLPVCPNLTGYLKAIRLIG